MSIIKKVHIMLPNKHLDYSKWSVIACDQHKNDMEYWEKLGNYVNDSPNSLNLVLPEIYLKEPKEKIDEYVKDITKNMQDYYSRNLLTDIGVCMVLVKRQISKDKSRLGIVLAVDLEEFDFDETSDSFIKSMDGSIYERISPRLEIRKNAIFEFPHIILLYDDREKKIAKKLYEKKDSLEKLYDFYLNMDGGKIEGYKIKEVDSVIKEFDEIFNVDYSKKYFNSEKPISFLVQDGLNSLVTAKEYWKNLKNTLSEDERLFHPARFILVEAININDEGINFSPIHRIVYNYKNKFLKGFKKLYKVNHKKVDEKDYKTYKLFLENNIIEFDMPNNTPLAMKLIQDYIDKNLQNNLEMSLDYANSLDKVKEICKANNKALGIEFPNLKKDELFEFVVKNGNLPRKSYSIGEAKDRRYYLEGHKIKLI